MLLDEEDKDNETRLRVQAKTVKPSHKNSKDQNPNVNIRRHRKKSKRQLEVLDSYFDRDREWSLELVERLSADLGLEKDQVYK